MALADITRDAVIEATREFDKIGRPAFLKKYGFRSARDYVLRFSNRYYDSKAIAGAAHGHLSPTHAPLTPHDFKGGDPTVRRKLRTLEFEVTGPETPVGFETEPGDILSNNELSWRFGIGNMGGMRRNSRRQHLVLISDPTKSLYDDRWEGEVLHYTGMGKLGPQQLDRDQNRTLAESGRTGETVHLFEVFEEGRYTYAGQVELAGNPYQEQQFDDDGNLRDVWMFPLRLRPEGIQPKPTTKQISSLRQSRERQAAQLSLGELRKRAQRGTRKPSRRSAVSEQLQRDQFVAAYVKKAAYGRCDLCQQDAPFVTKYNEPYLECHHVEWLGKGGEDTIDNAVALCPNCHRKMHSLNLAVDRKKLCARTNSRDVT